MLTERVLADGWSSTKWDSEMNQMSMLHDCIEVKFNNVIFKQLYIWNESSAWHKDYLVPMDAFRFCFLCIMSMHT